MATLKQDLIKLRTLKKKRDAEKKAFDKAEDAFKEFQVHCLHRMEAEETEGLRSRGTMFTPVRKEYASMQDRAEFVRWVESLDADDPNRELLVTKEAAGLLNALVRNCLDNNQELPPGVGFYPREYISMTGE